MKRFAMDPKSILVTSKASARGAPPLIKIQNLSKSYRRDRFEIPVLRNISLNIDVGEFVAFMGPSGSGKTTLLNLIAGLDKPSAGKILIAGTDLTELSETDLAVWRSRNVGFIFQFYNLIPVLTAVENVELPLILTPLSKKERRDHAETALRIVEVLGLMDRLNRGLGKTILMVTHDPRAAEKAHSVRTLDKGELA